MLHLYQRMLYCPRLGQPDAAVILAASGSHIHAFSAHHCNHLSSWPLNDFSEQNARSAISRINVGAEEAVLDREIVASERPQKRRKLSSAREDSSSSAEILVGGGTQDVDNSEPKQLLTPNIINLACTSTGQHFVAVSGDDKCIRVFELTVGGIMNQLSER